MRLLLYAFLVPVLAWASSADKFHQRFDLVKNDEGKVTLIKLKRTYSKFSLKPFIEQIKADLITAQEAWQSKGDARMISEINRELKAMGINVQDKDLFGEGKNFRDALYFVPKIPVNDSFAELQKNDFLKEFEKKIQEALTLIDLSVMANLDDSTYFYKKKVIYQVMVWALNEAKKRFSNVPILNLASYVVVKVHDLLVEQRTFHHAVMLGYFETVNEADLKMTKEEVDRAVSSIYENMIQPTDFLGSRAAQADWQAYGFSRFYAQVRSGQARIRLLTSGLGPMTMSHVQRLNYAFSTFKDAAGDKIYHLLNNAHAYSGKPALAFDFQKPEKIKRQRALINLGQLALGFLPLPEFIKTQADSFLDSMTVNQRRTEGALISFFELTDNAQMVRSIYQQTSNPYLLP
jgi:hypothetical protein